MLPTAYASEAILCLLSAILCLLTGTILLLFSVKTKQTNLFMGSSYLSFGLGFTVIFLIYNREIYHFPHLYRTGNIFLLSYMPLSYLYVRTSILQKRLTAKHLVHLIPILIYIVDYFPFFFSSAEHKLAAMSADLEDINILMRFRQGWLLPENFEVPLRTLQMTLYWILQIRLLFLAAKGPYGKDRSWIRWLSIYAALQLPIFLPALIVLLSGGHGYVWATSIPPAAGSLLSVITLLFHPHILYNIEAPATVLPGIKAKEIFTNVYIAQLNLRMETLMRQEMPYLNPKYNLKELADSLAIQPYKLSAFINQVTRKNFSDYLNQWRIQYCMELIREKKITHLNLHGIALKCGFSNRNTFSTAFKKFTGETPSAFLHSSNFQPS
jgi:AraC-like DNA-binding protein